MKRLRDRRTFAEEKRVHKGEIQQDTFGRTLLADSAVRNLDIPLVGMLVPRLVLKALPPLGGQRGTRICASLRTGLRQEIGGGQA